MTGHLDTVPLGRADWSVDPFSGETDGDRLFGRGTSDMKGGTAAIVVAAEQVAAAGGTGLELVLCAGEETGCEGALALVEAGALGECGAGLVAEPTTNYPCVAHKGVVWADAVTRGKTAHGSMPELGENAIYPLAAAVGRLQDLAFDAPEHPLLREERVLGRVEREVLQAADGGRERVDRVLPQLGHRAVRGLAARHRVGPHHAFVRDARVVRGRLGHQPRAALAQRSRLDERQRPFAAGLLARAEDELEAGAPGRRHLLGRHHDGGR